MRFFTHTHTRTPLVFATDLAFVFFLFFVLFFFVFVLQEQVQCANERGRVCGGGAGAVCARIRPQERALTRQGVVCKVAQRIATHTHTRARAMSACGWGVVALVVVCAVVCVCCKPIVFTCCQLFPPTPIMNSSEQPKQPSTLQAHAWGHIACSERSKSE